MMNVYNANIGGENDTKWESFKPESEGVFELPEMGGLIEEKVPIFDVKRHRMESDSPAFSLYSNEYGSDE